MAKKSLRIAVLAFAAIAAAVGDFNRGDINLSEALGRVRMALTEIEEDTDRGKKAS